MKALLAILLYGCAGIAISSIISLIILIALQFTEEPDDDSSD